MRCLRRCFFVTDCYIRRKGLSEGVSCKVRCRDFDFHRVYAVFPLCTERNVKAHIVGRNRILAAVDLLRTQRDPLLIAAVYKGRIADAAQIDAGQQGVVGQGIGCNQRKNNGDHAIGNAGRIPLAVGSFHPLVEIVAVNHQIRRRSWRIRRRRRCKDHGSRSSRDCAAPVCKGGAGTKRQADQAAQSKSHDSQQANTRVSF